MAGYLDYSGRDDVLGGGAQRIPVSTPKGTYHVWVKRIGNNPRLRVLLLHGGPGSTHEYLEACDSFLPAAGVEYYYYDQLGSGFSDQPDEPSLWELDRFVDEVEQVRQALGLDRDNFVLYGQSWGGILGMEYALHLPAAPARAGHLQHDGERPGLQRLCRAGADAEDGPGGAGRDQGAGGGRKIEDPQVHGTADRAALRAPCAAHPARGRARTRCSAASRTSTRRSTCPCRGPANWASAPTPSSATGTGSPISASIEVPALVIGARHDTMDPAHMKAMADALPQGRYLHCPDGSHLAMYDDQQVYFAGLVEFLHDLANQP